MKFKPTLIANKQKTSCPQVQTARLNSLFGQGTYFILDHLAIFVSFMRM